MIPSRHDNPFATCWTRPGALEFRFPDGVTANSLIDKLAANHWRGQLLGPHGSGKSTLLATLRPLIEATPHKVHIVDGFEQIGAFARWRLKRRCRRAGSGLLVTSHVPIGLPTLFELEPNAELVQDLVAELSRTRMTPVTPALVAASHARHGRNVRELLFDLYDQHEQLSRTLRTAPVTASY